jgi:hypothetical protein
MHRPEIDRFPAVPQHGRLVIVGSDADHGAEAAAPIDEVPPFVHATADNVC